MWEKSGEPEHEPVVLWHHAGALRVFNQFYAGNYIQDDSGQATVYPQLLFTTMKYCYL